MRLVRNEHGARGIVAAMGRTQRRTNDKLYLGEIVARTPGTPTNNVYRAALELEIASPEAIAKWALIRYPRGFVPETRGEMLQGALDEVEQLSEIGFLAKFQGTDGEIYYRTVEI